jgi:glycine cleavage system H lipoate-binding protein
MTTIEFRNLVKSLKKNYPLTGRVVISRRSIKKNFAITNLEMTGSGWIYRIYVDSKQDPGVQRDSLIHEWAHLRAVEESCDHSGRWGQVYSEIYTAWERDFK